MRAAIYFTPPADHPLTEKAATWLGRDAFEKGATRDQDPEIDPLVAEPARYGFHATLKAPFRLKRDTSIDDLALQLARFALQNTPFDLGYLTINRVGSFFALTPLSPPKSLATLEEAIRTTFEPFRAPLSEAEIERRQPASLSARQRENLERWGYPHVAEDFRFHMTLTGGISEEATANAIENKLLHHFASVLDQPVAIDALTLFVEPEPGAPFEVHTRYPLGNAFQSAE
ncbi:DUF1045 domain-containing protein [Tianweitania sp. BSSL-BM11]|uniref:DUF1045 domain-containing protein n=1 Tax=Tianweitania aestuarii TaxID=2814886 RepID=A0ABS5RUZ4_9HYPH|nr:DUF1045 domain-containing protein [Tianweitania aestuarii]MBS9719532.1 DUF1045 domain-containing protein [Tianweitania aestuarii]